MRLFISKFTQKIKSKLDSFKKRKELKTLLKKNEILVNKRKNDKIFVIGFNKTGTTSVMHALTELGFIVGHQRTAELLLDDVINKIFKSLNLYCKTAEAFQDIPFSLPNIYKILDEFYPNSKFILTIRDSPEQWYNSMCNFHTKLWGKDSNLPTTEDLSNASYVYKGFALKYINYTFGYTHENKEHYINTYNNYINEVRKYFKDDENKLLIINVSDSNSYLKFCQFLKKSPKRETFEWKNKT